MHLKLQSSGFVSNVMRHGAASCERGGGVRREGEGAPSKVEGAGSCESGGGVRREGEEAPSKGGVVVGVAFWEIVGGDLGSSCW